jgi:hypothetical protein
VASLNQPRIRQALAVNRINEQIKPIEGVPFHVSLVQPEGEFVHIAVKVLRAGMVIDAVHPALHDGPNGLDTVRVNRAALVQRARYKGSLHQSLAYLCPALSRTQLRAPPSRYTTNPCADGTVASGVAECPGIETSHQECDARTCRMARQRDAVQRHG